MRQWHKVVFEWHHWEEGGPDGWRVKPPIAFAFWFIVAAACWTALALVVLY